MAEATNRVYPSAEEYEAWYAEKAGIPVDQIKRGEMPGEDMRGFIGKAVADGVSPASEFAHLTPIERIDNPADGTNDGAKYVVYFKDAENNLWKAVNADASTLTHLTSGAEFDTYNTWTI
jgi:hypothetical protein